MRILVAILFCFLSIQGFSQSPCTPVVRSVGAVIGNQTVIGIPVNVAGFCWEQALIYYPDDYFTLPNKKRHTFIFLNGAGEGNSNDIAQENNASLPRLISLGLKPYDIDPISGDTNKWIVITPHCRSCGGAFELAQLRYTIPYLIANYNIDTNCLWAGGLSQGCRSTLSLVMGYSGGDTLIGVKITGIMPMAGAGFDNNLNVAAIKANLDSLCKHGLAVLYTIGDQDPSYNASGYFAYNTEYTNNCQPGRYVSAVIVGGTHSSNVWDPPFPLNSRVFSSTMNSWQKMASYAKTASTTLSANAGVDQTITLPTSQVSLTGSGSTPGGTTILGYQWSKISGPSGNTITSPSSQNTTVTGLVQGSYTFRVTVTNSASNQATDDMVVTVNPQQPNPPIVDAGGAQTIQLPTSSVILSGTVTPQGSNTISSTTWTRTSGPNNPTIVSPGSLTTNITGLIVGTYVFQLSATDNLSQTTTDNLTVIVNPAPAPGIRVTKPVLTEYAVMYIYSDSQSRKFTYNATTGHVQLDPFAVSSRKTIDGAPLFNTFIILDDQHYMWKTTPGTSNAVRVDTDTLGNPMSDVIAVKGYFYTGTCIRSSDSSIWYFGQDDYKFYSPTGAIINKPVRLNQPAGVHFKSLAMGNSLLAIASNGDVYKWDLRDSTYRKVLLPGKCLMADASHYDFQIYIVDNGAGSGMGYPYATGGNFTFWGGTVAGTISAPIALKTLWQMTQPIKSLAVTNNTIHYVDSLGKLFGIGDNPNGEIGNGQERVNHFEIYPTPLAWSWTPNEFQTGAPPIWIAQGTKFKAVYGGPAFVFFNYAIDVNDSLYFWGRNKSFCGGDGAANQQEVTWPNALDVLVPSMRTPISVAPTQTVYYNLTLPTINAGSNQNISATSTTLIGTGTPSILSAAGRPNYGYTTISSLWSKLTGPSCTIASPNALTTSITGLSTGTYTFQLKLTDNNTATWADTVQVVVNASLPSVNTSPISQTINAPVSLASLSGTATGNGGATIAGVQWTQVSGPNTASFSSSTATSTNATGLIQGTYVFRLTATDSNTNQSSATTTVIVQAAGACGCLILQGGTILK